MEKVTKIDFFEIDFLGGEKVRKLWTFWKPKSPISKIFWHFSTFCGTYRSGKAKSQSKKYPDFLLFDEHTVRPKFQKTLITVFVFNYFLFFKNKSTNEILYFFLNNLTNEVRYNPKTYIKQNFNILHHYSCVLSEKAVLVLKNYKYSIVMIS